MEIKKKYNNVLTIIIPRHVNRSLNLKKLSNKFKLRCQILNEKDQINSNTEILIINSFGVVSKYFNYCKNVFIGKSFVQSLKSVGGQNPIEAAKAACRIFHGPYVYNFKEIYELLQSYGISEKLCDEKALAKKLIENLEKPKEIQQQTINLLDNYGKNVLNQTIEELNKFMKLKSQNA
jgi:3-deoxy-D-manno-octulosonic-acid transferase